MAGATAATRCTVASRGAVFVLRVRTGGEGGATFAFASVITTVFSARTFFFVAGCFVAGATAVTGRAVARRRTISMLRVFRRFFVFVNRTGASVVTTIVSASAFFFRILLFVAVGAIFERSAAFAVIVFMRGVFAVGAFFAGTSMFTAIVSALAFFFRILFFVAVGAVFERSVALAVIVFMRGVFAVGAFFAGASMFTAIVRASANDLFRVASASVGRFGALGAAPHAANALATATRAALTTGIGGANVVFPVAKITAANPLDKVDNAAAVRVVSLEIVESCDVQTINDRAGNREIFHVGKKRTQVRHEIRGVLNAYISRVRISSIKRSACKRTVVNAKINRVLHNRRYRYPQEEQQKLG